MVEPRELPPADAPELTRLDGDCDWWADRSAADVRAVLEATGVAVGVLHGDRLVAAARVPRDDRYYATVYDAVVVPDRPDE